MYHEIPHVRVATSECGNIYIYARANLYPGYGITIPYPSHPQTSDPRSSERRALGSSAGFSSTHARGRLLLLPSDDSLGSRRCFCPPHLPVVFAVFFPPCACDGGSNVSPDVGRVDNSRAQGKKIYVTTSR